LEITMYNENTAPRARLLSLLVAAACAGVSVTAAADPTITLTAAYALNGGATVDGMLDPDATIYTTPSGGSDFYLSKSEAGSNVFFHTYGSTGSTTFFGARASGGGTEFYASTSALYSGSYTNTSGSALMLDFSFYVDGGETGLSGVGNGSANTRLQIRRNGSIVSQGDTLITQLAGVTTCSESDIGILGNWASCSAANASSAYGVGGSYTVGLGLVAAGETITIDYDIVSTVSGRGTVHTCGGGYGGYGGDGGYGGYGSGEPLPTYECSDFGGISRSGDPFGGAAPTTAADFSLNATAVALPEPASLALLAAAGGGWWLSRRRRSSGAGG
jgi:hypothetical protein